MMFEDLKGIEKEREERKREHTLEKLIEAGKKIIYEVMPGFKQKFRVEIRDEMQEKLDIELKDVKYTENDIKEYIYANANKDIEMNPARILGIYTGCLLTLLTQRNKKENKETILYLDGKENRFDYLFSHAKHFDAVVLDNFKGERICEGIARQGKAGLIAVKNIEGDAVLYAAAHTGIMNLILAYDLKGDSSLWNIAMHGGTAGIAAARSVEGNNLMWNLAEKEDVLGAESRIGLAIGDIITGDNPFTRTQIPQEYGKINKLLYGWQSGLHTINKYTMDKNKVIQHSQTPNKFTEEMKKYRMYEIFDLLKEMNEENHMKNIKKIREIYKTVEPMLWKKNVQAT